MNYATTTGAVLAALVVLGVFSILTQAPPSSNTAGFAGASACSAEESTVVLNALETKVLTINGYDYEFTNLDQFDPITNSRVLLVNGNWAPVSTDGTSLIFPNNGPAALGPLASHGLQVRIIQSSSTAISVCAKSAGDVLQGIICGGASDTLIEGDTSTNTIDGTDYEVTNLVTQPTNGVRFLVNNVASNILARRESQSIAGATITPHYLATQESSGRGVAAFCISSDTSQPPKSTTMYIADSFIANGYKLTYADYNAATNEVFFREGSTQLITAAHDNTGAFTLTVSGLDYQGSAFIDGTITLNGVQPVPTSAVFGISQPFSTVDGNAYVYSTRSAQDITFTTSSGTVISPLMQRPDGNYYFSIGTVLGKTSYSNLDTEIEGAQVIDCFDTDGGVTAPLAGEAYVFGSSQRDYCNPYQSAQQQSQNTLVEAFCSGASTQTMTVTCIGSTPYCRNAQCSATPPTCTDTDGGFNAQIQGTTTDDQFATPSQFTDYCADASGLPCLGTGCSVWEFGCNAHTVAYQLMPCSGTCTNGACSAASSLPAPIAKYSFTNNSNMNNTALDSSGNNLHGTLMNGPQVTMGKYGTALSFDGINDYINFGSPAALTNMKPLTISAWVQPTSNGGVVIGKRGGTCNGYWMLTPGANGIVWLNNRGVSSTTTAKLTANAWNHLSITWDGASTTKIYLNGNEVPGTLRTNSGTTDATCNLLIGSRNGTQEFFKGAIDEVRIYNQVLTPAQIQQDMNTP